MSAIAILAVLVTGLTVTFIATSATYFPGQATRAVAQRGTFSWMATQPLYVSASVSYTLYEFGNQHVLELDPVPDPVTFLDAPSTSYVLAASLFDPPINFPVSEYALSPSSVKNIDLPCLTLDLCRMTFGTDKFTRFGLALGTTDTANLPLSPPAEALYAQLYPKSALINQTLTMKGKMTLQY